MVNRHRRTSTAQMLKGGAGRSLPPLPIIGRASICPCPVGKADPASAHVPLVKALRYVAYPCCLRSRLRMEVFGLSPTFHVSVPLLVSSSEWPAGSLGPPSRKPPPSRSRATQHLCEMTLFVPFARSESYLLRPRQRKFTVFRTHSVSRVLRSALAHVDLLPAAGAVTSSPRSAPAFAGSAGTKICSDV